MKKEKLGMRIGESVFSIGYLIFDLIAVFIFLKHRDNNLFLLYAITTLVLCLGDSFHLVPRVIKNIKGESKKITWWMNLGLLITSITMTIFYILLFYIWKVQSSNTNIIIPIIIWISSILRILICLLPQNNWFNGGNKKLSLLRNGVFCITGLTEVIIFMLLSNSYGITTGICILFSFIFYMPVTLYAKEKPMIGMLMIPKTIMYIIIIAMGLSLI